MNDIGYAIQENIRKDRCNLALVIFCLFHQKNEQEIRTQALEILYDAYNKCEKGQDVGFAKGLIKLVAYLKFISPILDEKDSSGSISKRITMTVDKVMKGGVLNETNKQTLMKALEEPTFTGIDECDRLACKYIKTEIGPRK